MGFQKASIDMQIYRKLEKVKHQLMGMLYWGNISIIGLVSAHMLKEAPDRVRGKLVHAYSLLSV